MSPKAANAPEAPVKKNKLTIGVQTLSTGLSVSKFENLVLMSAKKITPALQATSIKVLMRWITIIKALAFEVLLPTSSESTSLAPISDSRIVKNRAPKLKILAVLLNLEENIVIMLNKKTKIP